MGPWQERRLLILGMTYPSYSRKYYENVCTGALVSETWEMVRIHPVPARHLEPAHKFKAFQWVRARVQRHDNDPRPESLRIDPDSIVPEETVPSSRPQERIQFLERSPHYISSVEELKRRYLANGTSLAAIRPKEITGLGIEYRPEHERKDWETKEKELLSQVTIEAVLRPPRRIDFPEARFRVEWICDDPECKGHKMGLEEWGLHELWRKYRTKPNGEAKVLEQMQRRLDLANYDVFFFLGSFRTIMWNFGLMGSCSAKRCADEPKPDRQLSLL